ncbi:MAG: SpoIIE family protein phosphatase [Chloroflexota bacterium]
MPIRVAIADDQALIRSGLSAFILSARDLILVGEAVTGEEAVQLCELVKPDVLLLDLKMPVVDGIEATRIIHQRWPEILIIVLTNLIEKGLARDALQAGAHGYLLKDITAEELSAAIRHLVEQRKAITPRSVSSSDKQAHLEALLQSVKDEAIDASQLSSLLRRHLPLILPGCQVEVRLLPGRPLMAYPAENTEDLPEAGWRWLQTQSSTRVLHIDTYYPWDEAAPCKRDLILAPVTGGSDQPLGGMAVWPEDAGEEIGCLLPRVDSVLEALALALPALQTPAPRAQRKELAEELAAAAKIQNELLPGRMPTLRGWDFAARLEPALETSGDFFDIIPLANNHWGLVIADVSDKGMGAALFMALSSTLIRTYAIQYPTLPALSISTVNERILNDSRSGMFVTAFYAVLEPVSGRLRYVNAGHNPPLLISGVRGKPVDRFRSTGMALGVMGDMIWKQKVARVMPGDVIVMYTDGVTDARDPQGRYYDEARLQALVRRVNSGTANEIIQAIIEDLDHFTGGAPRFDDVTLLVVKRSS